MTYRVLADPARAIELHKKIMGGDPNPLSFGIVLERDGKPVAAALYENTNGANMFAHIASEPGERLTRHFLKEIFYYPFVTVGVGRLTGFTPLSNLKARRFIQHLGFTAEAVLKRAARDGGDVMVYRMFKEDCRYVAAPRKPGTTV